MKRKTPLSLLLTLLSACVFTCAAGLAAAQTAEPSGNFKPVLLNLPKGYVFQPFPDNRKGQVLLNAKRPAGMYIVYPKAGETPEAFNEFLKTMVSGMFLHDSKVTVNWTESALPAHKGVDNETGTLFSSSDDKMEIQFAAYNRTVGETKVSYGYYAMRHKGEKKKDDGVFLDGSGNGVKEFEKFCQSIQPDK